MSETCPSYGPLAILASAQIKPSSNPLTGELVMNQPLDFNMNSTYVSLNHLTSQLKQVGEALENAVMDNPEFWADHDTELTERFNAWLASS